MAAVLSVSFYSYSYCEVTSGRTGNAAIDGLTWNMDNILPPQAGLVVDGLIYQYTMNKETEDAASVHIRNKLRFSDDYVLEEVDDWSNLPGSTINKIINFGDIPRESFGDGEIAVFGNGEVSDPNVAYNYKFDPCYIALSDPKCPGYNEALYDWLLENGLLNGDININDPYYDEYVQSLLNAKIDEETDDEEKPLVEEEEEADDTESKMFTGDALAKIANQAQQDAMLKTLQNVNKLDFYYTTTIQGGTYEDQLVLEDKQLPDNARAMSNLAQDTLHRSMVRSQYDKIN